MAYERAWQNDVSDKVSLSYNKNSLSGNVFYKRKVIAHFKPAECNFLQNLVRFIPTRMQEVINRNRDMTKYWWLCILHVFHWNKLLKTFSYKSFKFIFFFTVYSQRFSCSKCVSCRGLCPENSGLWIDKKPKVSWLL